VYVWVNPRPHTHTECRLSFPPQYYFSYRWGYYSAPLYIRGEVRKWVSLFYCHQITSHSEMPLYSLITHFTSLIFPHSHLLCWGTCLGMKSISQNLSIEGGILTMQPCLHLMLDVSMWFESLGTKMFFSCWGRDEKRVSTGAFPFVHKNWTTDRTSSCVHTHTVQYPSRNCVIHKN